ncbi:MAG: regulatory iron-sulfur-containing complex subunit RicT [Candidatus Aminicenantales bacterium]
MTDIISLVSESTGKILRAKRGGWNVQRGDLLLIETDLGGDLAKVVDISSAVCRLPKAGQGAVRIIHRATENDIGKFRWLRDKERLAFAFCLQRIRSHGLPMKLVGVKYFFNEKKGIFYYTADGRIDFRQLVKDLAKELRMRIEMRQIGVRDEAKMIGGMGVCGRSLCCASFMKTFEPVTIQKARKQQIVINPTKISGLCGRLMCCLAFEEDSRGRLYSEDENQIEE